MNLSRLALVAIATARLTRFVTSDWLGEWTLVRPLKRWAVRAESPMHSGPRPAGWDPDDRDPDPDNGWRSKLVKGLDCGYCLSPWIFGGLLIAHAIASRVPGLRPIFTWLLTTLAGSYVVGHLWDRLDNR